MNKTNRDIRGNHRNKHRIVPVKSILCVAYVAVFSVKFPFLVGFPSCRLNCIIWEVSLYEFVAFLCDRCTCHCVAEREKKQPCLQMQLIYFWQKGKLFMKIAQLSFVLTPAEIFVWQKLRNDNFLFFRIFIFSSAKCFTQSNLDLICMGMQAKKRFCKSCESQNFPFRK